MCSLYRQFLYCDDPDILGVRDHFDSFSFYFGTCSTAENLAAHGTDTGISLHSCNSVTETVRPLFFRHNRHLYIVAFFVFLLVVLILYGSVVVISEESLQCTVFVLRPISGTRPCRISHVTAQKSATAFGITRARHTLRKCLTNEIIDLAFDVAN